MDFSSSCPCTPDLPSPPQSTIVTDWHREVTFTPKVRLSTLTLPLILAGTFVGLWLWGHGNSLSFTAATAAVLAVGLPVYAGWLKREFEKQYN